MNNLKKLTKLNNMDRLIHDAKLRLLRMHFESGCGHIGGNLSCLDILMTLFHSVMDEGDQFVLSKGHAAGALYTTLWSIGLLTDDDLRTFHKDDTQLGGHPSPHHLPQIPFATGSLGHGLPLACGIALAEQLRGGPGRTYCLLSDGEWQEGSNWEALIFARSRNLPLTLIIDRNGLQGFGRVRDIAGGADIAEEFRAFGVMTAEVAGHQARDVHELLTAADNGLRAIVANTHKGNSISFMEDRMEWHYRPLNQALYDQALHDLEGEWILERKAA
jgi:transketolase